MTNDPQATGLIVAWLYRARPDKLAEFERTYGPDGDWAALFRRSKDFLGTELYRDDETYLVLDRWRTHAALERFSRDYGSEYAALSAATETLYREETRLGAFGRAPVPGTEKNA